MHVHLVHDNPACPGELLWCGTAANKKHGVFRAVVRGTSPSEQHESVLELNERPLGFSSNNTVQVLAVAFSHRVECYSWPGIAVIGTVDFAETEVRHVDFVPLSDGGVALTVLQSTHVSVIRLPPDNARAAAILRETPVSVAHVSVPWVPLCALAAVGDCFWVLHPHGAACVACTTAEGDGDHGSAVSGSTWTLGHSVDVAVSPGVVDNGDDSGSSVLVGGVRINSDVVVAYSRTSLHLLQTSNKGTILLSSSVADFEARCDQIAAVTQSCSKPNAVVVALWSSDSCVRVHALQWSFGGAHHDEAGTPPTLSLNELMGEVSSLERENDEVKWCGSVRGSVVVAHGSGFFGLSAEPAGDTEASSPSVVLAAVPAVSVAPVTPVVEPVLTAASTSVSVVLPVATHPEHADDDTVNIAEGADLGVRASSENPLPRLSPAGPPGKQASAQGGNDNRDEEVGGHSQSAEPTPVASTSQSAGAGASLVQDLGGLTTQPTPDAATETPQAVRSAAKVPPAGTQPTKVRAPEPAKASSGKSEREPMPKALRSATAAQRPAATANSDKKAIVHGPTDVAAPSATSAPGGAQNNNASRAATASHHHTRTSEETATFRAGSPPLLIPGPKPSVPRLSGRHREKSSSSGGTQLRLRKRDEVVAAELSSPAATPAVSERPKQPRGAGVEVALDTDDLASRRQDMNVYILTKLLGEGWETPVIFIPLSPGNVTLAQIRQTLERIHQKRLSLAFATPAGKLIELRPSTMKLFQGYDDEIKQIYCRALFPAHTPEVVMSGVNCSDNSHHVYIDRSNASSLGDLNVSAISDAGAAVAGGADAAVIPARRKLSSAEQRSVCARLHDSSMEQMQRSRSVLEARYWPRESSAPVLTHAREKLVIDRLYRHAFDAKNVSLAALQKKVDKEIFGAKPPVQLTEEQRKEVAERFYSLGMNQIRKLEQETESKGLPRKEFKKLRSREEWNAWQESMARDIGRKFKIPDPYSVDLSHS